MSIAQTFTVTVAGGKYYIDGVQQATVMIGAGLTYKFDQSDGTNGNHPLRFSSDSGNSTPYTTGVTTSGVPGNAGAYTQIEVAPGAPSTLYYYCTNHSGMGGQANTDGWGRSYWGQMSWNNSSVIETGWGRNTWGYQAWGDTPIITLTGLSATTSLGVPTELIEIKPGWGTLNWGENGWGSVESAVENLVGLSATTSLGTVIAKDVVGVTGLSVTSTLNSLSAVKSDLTFTLTGISLTSSHGLLTEDDHSVGLSGQSATTALGTVTTAGVTLVDPSALSATTTVGSFAFTSDPTISISGQSATTALGSLSPADVMGLTGQSSTSAIGSVTQTIVSGASLDGLGLTATTTLNDAKLILKYYEKLDPKTSTGYTKKTPKNTTGYSIKTPA
tara:strand:- start:32 stop:1195 length:1164 start_codon:yes stop_codon:yes gene_type:complete